MSDHPSLKMKPEKREKLFAAAAEAFALQGFEQASLNRIIGAVGMSKSSYYHYFEDKTDLFRQVLEQSFAPYLTAMEAFDLSGLTAGNFWMRLVEISRGIEAVLAQNPGLVMTGRMFYRNLDSADGACHELMDRVMGVVTGLLEHGQGLGVIRTDLEAALLLEAVMGLGMALDRWGLEHFEEMEPAEIEAYGTQAVDMFRRILTP